MRRHCVVRSCVRSLAAGVLVGVASVPVSVAVGAVTPWHTTTSLLGAPARTPALSTLTTSARAVAVVRDA